MTATAEKDRAAVSTLRGLGWVRRSSGIKRHAGRWKIEITYIKRLEDEKAEVRTVTILRDGCGGVMKSDWRRADDELLSKVGS